MKSKWTFEILRKEALKYKSRSEFKNRNKSAYNAASKMRVLDKVCAHMPKHVDQSGENNPTFKWTLELLKMEALKYHNRVEFRVNSPGAYGAAWKIGIIDQICTHMVLNCRKPWTEEELLEEASKYSSRKEFQKENRGAYQAAAKMGILDKVCSHMKYPGDTSSYEQDLLNTVRLIYPNAKRLRDRKVNIIGKSHIRGFDLDIYLEDKKMAIEFDGTYWHSENGLKRSRSDWSNEDITNYHSLKDDWFATKNIKVLHIKESEWIENKSLCIKKCFKFLEG